MSVVNEYLTIDGRSSLDFHTRISGSGTFGSPKRDVDRIPVPGRNGEVIIDNGRYENIPVEFPAFIAKDFEKNFGALRDYLSTLRGYKRLEDSYHPEEYRMAYFDGEISPKTTTRNLAGTFTLAFDCKPQRFLKSGEIPITLTDDGVIFNQTLHDAEPVIRAYGVGTFSINGVSVEVTDAEEYTDIDSTIQEAYKEGANCNGSVILENGVFPTLAPGANQISITGFTQIRIRPNWWTI